VPVPSAPLQRAIQESRRIFLKARIETSWLVGRSGEVCFLQPTEVPITIIPRSLKRPADDAFGTTVRSKERGFTIAIFYEHIDSAGRKNVGDPSALLGMAMTHEIGHIATTSPGGATRCPHDAEDFYGRASPSLFTLRNLFPELKAIHALSGDQNGCPAFSRIDWGTAIRAESVDSE
jgi:hypothetical protein